MRMRPPLLRSATIIIACSNSQRSTLRRSWHSFSRKAQRLVIISGDIGGTKCNLAAYLDHSGTLRLIFKQRYATRDFSSFEQLIETFAQQALPSVPNRVVVAAGFGVPGTVVDGRLHAAHIPWVLDAASLAARLSLPRERVVLMNDLVATARGLQRLGPEDILYLNRGVDHP